MVAPSSTEVAHKLLSSWAISGRACVGTCIRSADDDESVLPQSLYKEVCMSVASSSRHRCVPERGLEAEALQLLDRLKKCPWRWRGADGRADRRQDGGCSSDCCSARCGSSLPPLPPPPAPHAIGPWCNTQNPRLNQLPPHRRRADRMSRRGPSDSSGWRRPTGLCARALAQRSNGCSR